MDALSLLTADHNRVRGLFARFQAAEDNDDTAQMADLATKIITELEIHTQIEEEIFYPEIAKLKSKEAQKKVIEANEEHSIVKHLLAELEGTDAATIEFAARLKLLKEIVLHHVKEEEKDLFPMVKENMSEVHLAGLGQQLMERRESLMAGELKPTTLEAKRGMMRGGTNGRGGGSLKH